MTSRELVLRSLDHKPLSELPVDVGATAVTGMHVNAVAVLRDYLGLEKRPVKVVEPYQMLGEIDDELMKIIGVDVTGLYGEKNMFGFSNSGWKEWIFPVNGLKVLVPENFNVTVNDKGDVFMYPEGDLKARPSACMPKGAYFFDTIIRQKPIDEDKLDPADNLEEYKEISEHDLFYLEREARKAAATGRAVIASLGGTALGDIALVPAPAMKDPKGIRDIEEWYMSTAIRQDYVHRIFSVQTDIALGNLKKINDKLGKYIDVIFICGTDFGTQTSTFCSPDTFRSLYMPYYRKINEWIHRNTGWKTFKHSCGSVSSFIPLFVEAGFDILNPVQVSAANMDPARLKAEYGDSIVFWGGGANTQKTLCFGTPQEVSDEVRRNCEIFMKNGGFIFNTVHNVQGNTPVKNLAALFDAVKSFKHVAR